MKSKNFLISQPNFMEFHLRKLKKIQRRVSSFAQQHYNVCHRIGIGQNKQISSMGIWPETHQLWKSVKQYLGLKICQKGMFSLNCFMAAAPGLKLESCCYLNTIFHKLASPSLPWLVSWACAWQPLNKLYWNTCKLRTSTSSTVAFIIQWIVRSFISC